MDFDKVPHSLLIHKLHHYGIRGEVNNWIKNWLSDRKQAVVAEGEKSEPVSVESGVPQGSVLGPGLFLYYINDFPSRLRSKVSLFADDTITYLVIILPKDTETLQEDLNELATWEDRWHMQFHVCCAHRLWKESSYPGRLQAAWPNSRQSQISQVSWSYPNWGSKMGPTHKQHLWQGKLDDWLLKMKPEYWCDLAQGKSILHSCETSSWVWNPYTQTNIQKLEMVQRRAARYVKTDTGIPHVYQTTDMLSTMNWWSVQDRRRDARLCMMYKVDRNLVAITKDKRLAPTNEKNPALSHQSLPDTELQNRSKKELILPKDSSWLECASSRHHWRRVPGCFQSPGDNSDPLTNAWKIF